MIVAQEPTAQSEWEGGIRRAAHKEARSCASANCRLFRKYNWGAGIEEEQVCGEDDAGGVVEKADEPWLDGRSGGGRLFEGSLSAFGISGVTVMFFRLCYHFVLAT